MILDGLVVAGKLKDSLQSKIADSSQRLGKCPGLAVILVGDDPASNIYVNGKRRACEAVGIKSFETRLPQNATTSAVREQIQAYNENPEVSGILLQLPLPSQLDKYLLLNAIDVNKDVDGAHDSNVAKLQMGLECFEPCTPRGIITILKHYDALKIEGSDAVVIGRSTLVGIPITNLLRNNGATVVNCHSKTKNIKMYTKGADLVVVAVGKPAFIDGSYLKQGAVVIDVGINRQKDGIVGDVGFESAKAIASSITPVPGGVGPMTIATLLENTWRAFSIQNLME